MTESHFYPMQQNATHSAIKQSWMEAAELLMAMVEQHL